MCRQSDIIIVLTLVMMAVGCQSSRTAIDSFEKSVPEQADKTEQAEIKKGLDRPEFAEERAIELVSLHEPEFVPVPEGHQEDQIHNLEDVIASVYASYPLLQAAFYNRNIAQGDHLAAQGNFDTKFKAASENGPTGFYQTYRQGVGLEQPTMWGGSVFGGYRIGRGDFQPWYLERQTNDGGEFKAGVSMPLLRNRDIDTRRAELWSTAWGTHLVEPQIQQELIGFVLMASDAYWSWVAAGQLYQIQIQLLDLATARNKGLEREVELGSRDPPDLKDNQRSIVSREAKVIAARQKMKQASYKLSIYLRDANGVPIVLSENQIPAFPELDSLEFLDLEQDIQTALNRRPELQEIDLIRKQLDIEQALAMNNALPEVEAIFQASQDVGEPTSSKRDKSEFELEAAVMVNVPLQRRKARGKQDAVSGKISQLSFKRKMVEDKIVAELQNVHAALQASIQTVRKSREAVELARYMAEVERKKFLAGTSNLLTLNLREQQAASTAESEVEALLEYFRARAAYRAVMAQDNQSSVTP